MAMIKNMTQEDKAKAYDEAITRAKEINREHSKRGFKPSDDVLYIFPELKDNEDEHRQWILEYLYDGLQKSDEQFKDQFKQAISWLEKQGEKKNIRTINDVWKDMRLEVGAQASGNRHEPQYSDNSTKLFSLSDIDEIIEKISEKQGEQKFPSLSEKEIVCLKRILDFLREEHNSYLGKDFTNEIAVLEWLITHPVLIHSSESQPNQGSQILANSAKTCKVEQNPAWSEEDKKRFESTLHRMEIVGNGHAFGQLKDDIDWLKVLKERYTWKPSDEQIEALEHFVRCVGESGYMSPYDRSTKIVYSLLDDLKKLKG